MPSVLRGQGHLLRRFADAAPGRGALPVLGAPLLAVIATFFMQPRASGFEPGDPPDSVFHEQRSVEAHPLSYAASEVLQSIEARDSRRARALIARLSADDVREHGEALGVMLQCVETPGGDVTANAYRYYLERAPESLRQPLYAACMGQPR